MKERIVSIFKSTDTPIQKAEIEITDEVKTNFEKPMEADKVPKAVFKCDRCGNIFNNSEAKDQHICELKYNF